MSCRQPMRAILIQNERRMNIILEWVATVRTQQPLRATWSDEIARMLGALLLALATHQECRMMGDPTSQLKNIEQLTYWRNTLIDQRAKACRMREVLEHNAFNALDTMD